LSDVDLTTSSAASMPFEALAETHDDVRVAFVSFDDFYRTHRTSVARALALTLRDVDLATEATDEAMARAYQRWAQVRSIDNPAGWVYRVGLNWSRSVIRRITRPAPTWVGGSASSPAPVVQDPAIDRALAELSVDHRAVVVCRVLLGFSEAHTAEVLGIRPGTVKSRLSRALTRLTPLLATLHAPTEEDPR
jgi:RNA polymerase sigma-70 factor (ECF subfamily)